MFPSIPRPMPQASITSISFGDRLSMIIIKKNVRNSKGDIMSIYRNPYAKVTLNCTAIINADKMIAIFPFPFAYQHRNAKNGEITVNPIQIIA